jgi:hypothetical protein
MVTVKRGHLRRLSAYLHDHSNGSSQLMTLLFAEAEEREESHDGEMLRRMVFVQDKLLSLGVNGVSEWLKAAEPPEGI